jgi:hypothetical protein
MEKSYNKRCGDRKENLCHKINVESLKQELSKKFSSVNNGSKPYNISRNKFRRNNVYFSKYNVRDIHFVTMAITLLK